MAYFQLTETRGAKLSKKFSKKRTELKYLTHLWHLGANQTGNTAASVKSDTDLDHLIVVRHPYLCGIAYMSGSNAMITSAAGKRLTSRLHLSMSFAKAMTLQASSTGSKVSRI